MSLPIAIATTPVLAVIGAMHRRDLDDEDLDCPTCGGHGGGPDAALLCTTCRGTGRRRVELDEDAAISRWEAREDARLADLDL